MYIGGSPDMAGTRGKSGLLPEKGEARPSDFVYRPFSVS